MELKPSEIDFIEQIGELDGSPVRMARTLGGYWIALGKPKGKAQDEALAAGSHPAVVKHNIEKQFQGFRPAMAKSEFASSQEEVTGFSELLPKELRDSGYDLYALEKNQNIEYILTKYNNACASLKAQIGPDSIKLNKSENIFDSNIKVFSKAVAEAAAQMASNKNKFYVECEGQKFLAKKLIKG